MDPKSTLMVIILMVVMIGFPVAMVIALFGRR